MPKLKIIDNKDKFLLEVDGTEIPYVTSYELTRTVSGFVVLKLALSMPPDSEVSVETDKLETKVEQ